MGIRRRGKGNPGLLLSSLHAKPRWRPPPPSVSPPRPADKVRKEEERKAENVQAKTTLLLKKVPCGRYPERLELDRKVRKEKLQKLGDSYTYSQRNKKETRQERGSLHRPSEARPRRRRCTPKGLLSEEGGSGWKRRSRRRRKGLLPKVHMAAKGKGDSSPPRRKRLELSVEGGEERGSGSGSSQFPPLFFSPPPSSLQAGK